MLRADKPLPRPLEGPGPNPNRELAADQHDQTVDQRDSDTVSGVQQSLEALAAEIDRFLAGVPVAEYTAAKLNRLLRGFLEREVLPVSDRAPIYLDINI
jgi:hypothetical protein